jgi:uncharacterized membrane protein YbhN (UPF0104 family)
VDLDQIAVSNRRFGEAPFALAIISAVLCLFLRAVRLRVLARRAGIPSEVKGQLSAYLFGRGLNLFFPFGPGELGTIQALTAHGATPESAALAVFRNRVFEILAIGVVLLGGFVYLGWGGAVGPFVWTLVLIAGVVSLTRPFGRGRVERTRRLVGGIWSAFRGDAVLRATAEMLRTPGFFLGVLLLSLVTFGLEVLAFWNIKQAFSAPLDDYVLMKDLTIVPFTVVVAVAGLARVVPYTFAGFGVVEFVMVMMFSAFGEGYLGGTTVALLSALVINGTAFVLFLAAVAVGRCPSILEVWHLFFDRSVARARLAASVGA